MNIQKLNKAKKRSELLHRLIDDKLDTLPDSHVYLAIEHHIQSIEMIIQRASIHGGISNITEEQALAIQECQKFYKRAMDIELKYVDNILDEIINEIDLTNADEIRKAIKVLPAGFHRSELRAMLYKLTC